MGGRAAAKALRKQLVAQRAAAAIAGGDDEVGTPGTPATPGTPSAAAAPPPPPLMRLCSRCGVLTPYLVADRAARAAAAADVVAADDVNV